MQPSPVYTKLNRDRKVIRLLSISSTTDSLMECDSSVFELDKAPPFDALSYVWGDPTITKEIEFCGATLQITLNLFAALTRLRHKTDVQWLWVDALCINQNDTAEKNYQVPMMRHIYRRAGRVLSWIGEAEEDTALAFSLIERWADAVLSTSPKLDGWPNSLALRAAVAGIDQPFDERAWAAVGKFFLNTYWQRVWIVQEVSLAEQCLMICGDYEIPFTKVLWCFRAWLSGDLRSVQLDKVFRSVTVGISVFGLMRLAFEWEDVGARVSNADQGNASPKTRSGLARLPFIIKRTSCLSATDARDKIFGILGLLDVEDLPILVDYSRTIDEAYTEATRSLIDSSGRLDILAFAGTGSLNNTPSPSLPSWVPDYRTHHFDVRFCEDSPYYDIMFFNASGNTRAVCSVQSQDKRQIRIKGLLCDEIVAVAAQNWDAAERFRQWLLFILENQHRLYIYRVPLQQVLFRTLVVDHLWRGFETPNFLAIHLEYEFYRMAAGFLTALKYIFEDKPIPYFGEEHVASVQAAITPKVRELLEAWLRDVSRQDDDENAKQTAQIECFLGSSRLPGSLRWPTDLEVSSGMDETNLVKFRYHLGMTDSRCLFVTKQGYIGVGPGMTREGDRLFIPLGCCLPIAIRENKESFELIGDTFVCGMMQGEIIGDSEHSDLDLQDIVLK